MPPVLRLGAPVAILAFLLLAVSVRPPVGLAEEEAGLDYAYFKAVVSPVLRQYCAECHADPRKRKKTGKFFLRPAPGRKMRERFEERNYETLLRFVEAGDPSASVVLLKALGPDRGGVAHEGGAILRDNMPGYGALIDFINGARREIESFRPPPTAAGQPDFLFFYKRIEPVLLGVCAECHAGRGKGRHRLITHERGEPFPIEDHYANFTMVQKLLKPGEPERSRFLQKPLAAADGGIKHRGGDRIRKGTANYENWVLFINGEKGPPLPTAGEQVVPTLTAEGLVIQAEDFHFEGDLEDTEMKGAEEYYVAQPGESGGRLTTDLRVLDAGPYELTFRLARGTSAVRWGFEGGAAHTLAIPTEEEQDEHGFAVVGPTNLLDGSAPLEDARGGLALSDGVLHMDGRKEEAAWLSPSRVRHTGVSTKVVCADEEDGGDDALLLFDMQDSRNGKFVGLTDGGRRFVIGLLEAGRMRVTQAVKAREPPADRRELPREIKVEFFGEVAVGSLDARPLVFMNLSGVLGRGRFGVMTHGITEVHAAAALEEYEVYNVKLRTGPVVHLPAGRLRLWVELPPLSGALDAVRFVRAGG